MKLELREVCTRFTQDLKDKFGENLKKLKNMQPSYMYYREMNIINKRYHDWIHGYADEYGKRYSSEYYFEHANDIKHLLIDHMFRLTKNVAIREWLKRGGYVLWDTIVNDMYKLDRIHYSRVLYRFTYSAIINYLHIWKEIFITNWGEEEGGKMYDTLEKHLTACLNVKECSYWSTTEE